MRTSPLTLGGGPEEYALPLTLSGGPEEYALPLTLSGGREEYALPRAAHTALPCAAYQYGALCGAA